MSNITTSAKGNQEDMMTRPTIPIALVRTLAGLAPRRSSPWCTLSLVIALLWAAPTYAQQDTAPKAAKPADAKPADAKPAKAAATKPTGAKPAKATKPAAAKPIKPTAAKPAKAVPAKPGAANPTKPVPARATQPPAPPRIAAPPRRVPARRAPATIRQPKPLSRAAKTPKQRCVGFFRARAYAKAARCFSTLGMGMGSGAKLPSLRRYEKGQLLRNAAVAFEKAAVGSKRVEIAAWWRERAVKLMRVYRTERLCENNYRCRIALDLETRIYKKIGYLQLTVVTNHSNSLVRLLGHKFKKSFRNRMTVEVRPGPYKLFVTYPDEKKPREKQLMLAAFQNKIETFFPKIKQGQVSKVSIGLYISASLLLAGGGALAGIGTAQYFLAVQEWNQPTTLQSKGPALVEERNVAQPMIWGGISAAGAGLVLLVLGFAFHKPPPPPKAINMPPPPRRTASGYQPLLLDRP